MRILLIGSPTLYNESIKKLLLSKDGFKLHQITSDQFMSGDYNTPSPICDVGLFDTLSFPENAEEYVKQVIIKGLSNYLIILHPDYSEKSIQQLLSAGADDCISLYAEVAELFESLTKYNN